MKKIVLGNLKNGWHKSTVGKSQNRIGIPKPKLADDILTSYLIRKFIY